MSILFGFIFMIFYSFINEIFYKSKVKFIFEISLFNIGSLTYFYLVYKINTGILNIYMVLFILIGVILYQIFYSKYFIYLYSNIHKKLLLFSSKHVIIRKRKEKKYGKKRSTTRFRLEQKQSNNNVTTWHIDSPSSLRR
jgi:hypothetical protein